MDHCNSLRAAIMFVYFAFHGMVRVYSSDPELTYDFTVFPETSPYLLNGSYFTSTILENRTIASPYFVTVIHVNDYRFPALKGLGISSSLFTFPPGAVNPPHSHPRASEVLYVIRGILDVGFLDTSNILRTQTLRTGDLFLVPRGLVHYQINRHHRIVKVLVTFNSANPGLVMLPDNVFKSGITDDVLQKAFAVSRSIIHELKNATVN